MPAGHASFARVLLEAFGAATSPSVLVGATMSAPICRLAVPAGSTWASPRAAGAPRVHAAEATSAATAPMTPIEIELMRRDFMGEPGVAQFSGGNHPYSTAELAPLLLAAR